MKNLNEKFIVWYGRDTRGLNHWKCFGNTYQDIWCETVRLGVNHYEDEEHYMLSKIGKCNNDYWNEDGDYLEEEFYNDISKVEMNDEDYYELLVTSKGNAYYSDFEYFGND